MQPYLKLLQTILDTGHEKSDRTGTGTISIFGYQMRLDLTKGFPLLTTKKVIFNSVVHELLWFLKGATNIHDGLSDHTKIWHPWADEAGNVGPIYGYQWRSWEQFQNNGTSKKTIDQLGQVIDQIKTNPDSRRLLVSAWNVADLDRMALPPCHVLFQFYVRGPYLDCQLYQRSADVAIGVPFNIASYALLQTLIANECGLIPGHFVHTFGDAHIYCNHIEGVHEQLTRQPTALPRLSVAKKPVFDITADDITLHDYVCDPFIKFPIAV